MTLSALAAKLDLGSLLEEVHRNAGGWELLDHWQQGEFHHDLVLRVPDAQRLGLPAPILVVATNCNGGVKELMCFSEPPPRAGLWRRRCPANAEFDAEPVTPAAELRTIHWFDPCELLGPDARSELRPDARERQPGGGWRLKGCGTKKE